MQQKILVTEKKISDRLTELAKEIAIDYRDKEFVLIGILKGSFMVIADLARSLYQAGCQNYQVSFLVLRSYSSTQTTSESIKLVTDVDIDVKNCHVLIVDDIFDTGKSFEFVDLLMKDRGALSIEGFALLSKPDRHEVVYRPKYIGFEVPNVWVEGYGMDFDEKGRGNPNVVANEQK